MAGIVQGKVVVVTGAGRGIGREIALLMAREGAKVVVNDIGASLGGEGTDQTPAEEVVSQIKKDGGEAVASYDSVAEWDSAHRIVQTAVDKFGRIDCVVNNAGILRDIIFHKLSFEDWDSVVKVMLYGAFKMSRAAATHFRQQNSGAFVHMTSNSGMTGSIPSNTPDKAARVAQRQAVTPDKNAPLVVYLASDSAKDVNGQVFYARKNEIFLMSQIRPRRGIHRSEGWTPQAVAEHAIPALRSGFYPLERNQDVFNWDPI